MNESDPAVNRYSDYWRDREVDTPQGPGTVKGQEGSVYRVKLETGIYGSYYARDLKVLRPTKVNDRVVFLPKLVTQGCSARWPVHKRVGTVVAVSEPPGSWLSIRWEEGFTGTVRGVNLSAVIWIRDVP